MTSVPVLQDKEEFDVIPQLGKVSHQGVVTYWTTNCQAKWLSPLHRCRRIFNSGCDAGGKNSERND